MMMMKRCLAYGRVAIPLLLGVCIGVALSLIILPLLEESSCELERSPESYAVRKERSSSNDDVDDSKVHPLLRGIDIESFRNSDFEPRIIKTPPSGSQTAEKPRRYRFAASELDMKKTLLVAYLTTPSQLMQRVLALNRTLNQPELDYPEVLFFVDGRTAPNGLPLVTFNLEKPGTLPLLTIRHLVNHYLQSYKFFMIVPDSTYVKTSQLNDLLVNAQAMDNPYIGVLSSSGGHCVKEVGYILSQPSLIRFESKITECQAMYSTTNDLSSGILEQCLASSSQCTSAITSADSVFKSMSLDEPFDSSVLRSHLFKDTLSFANVHAVNTIYQLHRQVAKDEIDSTMKRIDDIRQQISAMVDSVNGTADWPIGVAKPFSTSNRYDVLRWTLVEQNTSHLEWDYVNNEPLIGAYKVDQQNMVEAVMAHVNRAEAKYELLEVVQVYRRVDPTRGMEYQITLQLKDKLNNVEQLKTFELVKPLSRFQTLSQPFASTTATVYLLVPILPEHTSQRFVSLMKSFSDTFKPETARGTVLQWVLLYSESEYSQHVNGNDVHSKSKKLITAMSIEYSETTIKWIAVHGDDLNQVSMVTQCAAKLKESDIIITMTVSTEMSETFVNRAKGNTIRGTQIYAPIAFWQYEPTLIHDKPSPKVELSRPAGHFGENWFDHMSFFVSDFTSALKPTGSEYSRIVDVFIKANNVEILRSADPDLRVLHSSEQSCDEFVGAAENGECETRRVDHLGSASVIAKALFKQGAL